MTITYSFAVKTSDIGALRTVVRVTNARYDGNPVSSVSGGLMVTLKFYKPSDYAKFHQEWNRLTQPIVEVDSRKWYTKYLNRIKLIFRKKDNS